MHSRLELPGEVDLFHLRDAHGLPRLEAPLHLPTHRKVEVRPAGGVNGRGRVDLEGEVHAVHPVVCDLRGGGNDQSTHGGGGRTRSAGEGGSQIQRFHAV